MVEGERRLQGRQGELAAAQSPFERILVHLRDPAFFSDDEPRLRPAEHLIAAEGDDIGAEPDALGHQRLLGQAISAEIDERAATQIFHDRDLVSSSDCNQLGQTHLGDKPDDFVVARVDFEEQGGFLADGLFIVLGMGPIGAADFFEDGTALRHDLRNPKGAPDLDQLAARDDNLLSRRCGIEPQQDRRGVVVDHGGGLGTGKVQKEPLDGLLAFASLALVEIVFEVDRMHARLADGLDRCLGEERTAQIGVQHRAGGVDDPHEARLLVSVDLFFDPA